MDTSRILTGVKHIYFTPWANATTPPSLSDHTELLNIIADSTEISQDDPETSSIDCETRDEPIIETVTAGAYTISMDSADINFDILEACFGFTRKGNEYAAAPSAYEAKYMAIEVEMSNTKLLLPKVLITSKIDASSLKTDVCKGTISGTGYSAKVAVGSNAAIATPFIALAATEGGSFPEAVITNL